MAELTEDEKDRQDIETMLESIRIDWQELASKPLKQDVRREILENINSCAHHLREVLSRRGRRSD
jgi:hypothetical protein